jgi:hypothetical protein
LDGLVGFLVFFSDTVWLGPEGFAPIRLSRPGLGSAFHGGLLLAVGRLRDGGEAWRRSGWQRHRHVARCRWRAVTTSELG